MNNLLVRLKFLKTRFLWKMVLSYSILAGCMIGLAGVVNLSVDNKFIGAFLFSFGLITILAQGLFLYTGKIGTINLSCEWVLLPIIILGNFIGTNIIAWGVRFTRFGEILNQNAQIIAQNKLADSWFSILLLSIGCGIMMYLAVKGWLENSDSWLIVILPVMIFILSGFEHSIANMFYFAMAGEYSLKAFGYIFIMLIGNAIGSLAFKQLKSVNK
ncbi:MAG: formate/nitrite transporter [Clostridiaceae bacterium]|nr:MAG: formate/nitrite transporter [Clostridiaceae bacterium]